MRERKSQQIYFQNWIVFDIIVIVGHLVRFNRHCIGGVRLLTARFELVEYISRFGATRTPENTKTREMNS